MVKRRTAQTADNPNDGPYRRVGILVFVSIAIIVLLFGINAIAKGFGGNERRLAEAMIATLQKPYINGSLDVSHQAQMSALNIQSDIQLTNGEALRADSTVTLGEDAGEKVEVPLNVRADFGDGAAYYINANSLDKIARPLGEAVPALNADLLSVSEKIDGKWLKYETAKGASDGCFLKIVDKIQHDESAAKEVTRAYMSHRFIEVNSVDKKGSSTQVYKAELDGEVLSDFMDKLYSTKFVEKLTACKDVVEQVKSAAAQSQQQVQSKNQAVQNPTATITVKDDVIVKMVSSQAAQSGASTISLALDFDKNNITMPTDNIVDREVIKHELEAIGKFIVEQQTSQQQSGGMGSAGGPVIQPR